MNDGFQLNYKWRNVKMYKEKTLETLCLSSMTKVFADEALNDTSNNQGSALWNETYSFQIAYQLNMNRPTNIQVEVQSEIAEAVQVHSVGLVPSEFPIYRDHDAEVLRTTPSLYPDPLYPVKKGIVTAFPNQWRSLWITIDVTDKMKAGTHAVTIEFKTDANEIIAEENFSLDVIPVELPEQQLIHTQWFHTDCLADQYDTPVFSDRHWELIGQYVKSMTDHGINMVLTPLFTPPLDTAEGSERPTVQLVDVKKDGNKYSFSLNKLKRWVDLCKENGMKYFEFSHLFTQWGAYHAPKIIANVNGEDKRIFGWETDASGEDYKKFLKCFLPELIQFINEHHLNQQVYFHVSDEPYIEHIESYKNVSDIIHQYLSDFPVIDALSDFYFYEKGLVKNPIPSTNCIEPFLEHQVEDLWTYYCCSQYKEVANRFFSFPSARNRVLGMQLYKFDIAGFLQWGFNFWFSQFSRSSIDPFRNTDAGHGFPSGDAFMVYPGQEGPITSLRLKVFYEGLQDLRAFKMLERKVGKGRVLEILETNLDAPLTFKEYPVDSNWLLKKREIINKEIAEVYLYD